MKRRSASIPSYSAFSAAFSRTLRMFCATFFA